MRPPGCSSQRRVRPCRTVCALVVLAGALFLAGGAPSLAAEGDRYRGRLLAEVLKEFQDQGMVLIFSSAVVPKDLRVSLEPAATEPRAILEEILGPLGLEARDGPSGSILVVPARPVTGSITGRVISQAGGQPIAGALLRLPGTKSRALSREDGSFDIAEVPEGEHLVVVDAVGYATATFARVRVEAGDDTELTVELASHPGFVTEVIVTPNKHSVVRQELESSRTVTGDEAVLAPTFAGDVTRVVELLPGVAAPDNSAAFNVRGSVARDVSMVLDGLELYDPFHLQSFQSPFSLIDSNVVDKIDFFGGGYTADFGDRHGGFIEVSTIGPGEAHRGEVELGTVNSRASYQAPFVGGRGSWLVSARGWYPEAVLETTELGQGENLEPRFADLYAKAAFSRSERHLFSAHTLLSYDELNFEEVGEDINEEVDAETKNWYVWLRSIDNWSPAWSTETVLSVGQIDRIRDGVSALDEAVIVNDDRTVDFLGLKHDSTWQISDAQAVKAGVDARWLDATYRYSNETPADPSESTFRRLDPDGAFFGVYAAHRGRPLSSVVTEVGLRWDRQTHTDDNQISPRLNVMWRPGERSEIRLAAGRFNQSQRIHELQIEDGETEFSPAEVSEQAELSVRHSFRPGLTVRLDAYYRRLTDLRPRYENLFEPIEFFPETTEDRVLVAPDGARLRGAELLVGGDPNRPFYWWVSYVRSSAEDQVDGRDEPRSWDQPHAGRFLASYRRDNRWFISLSGSAHTGWPTTAVTGLPFIDEDGEMDFEVIPGERNSIRFSRYARLDFKARRGFTLPRGRLWLTLEIVNVTDRENECCIDEFEFEQNPDGSIDQTTLFDHWLGGTPSFTVLWEF